MRYDLKKYLFVGLEEERDAFFKKAQEAGIIHFIDFKPNQTKVLPENFHRIIQAIKVLRGLPVLEQEETEDYNLAEDICSKILLLKSRIDALKEEERILRLEISRVHVFGDYSIEDIAYIEGKAKRKIQFYCSKRGHATTIELPDELIHIGSEHDLDYFIGINQATIQYPKFVEMQIERPLGQLVHRLKAVHEEIHTDSKALNAYAKYNTFLHHAFIQSLNSYNLEASKAFVDFPLSTENLFVVQGWTPQNKQKELEGIINEFKLHAEEIDIDANEVTPTCLQNTGPARIGEDLVHIYDTPSSTDKDPSLWVLIFFCLFFSMIIGDGGYGLVLLLIALYFRYKHSNLRGAKRRFLDLVSILGFSCVVWGVLTTSFFGITIAPDNPVRHVSVMSWLVEKKAAYHIRQKDDVYEEWMQKYPAVKDVKDPTEFLLKTADINEFGKPSYEAYDRFADNILMEFALFIGVLHIIISMLRYSARNLSNIGWIIFIIGAYLYTPIFLNASSYVNFIFGVSKEAAEQNGLYLIYGGISLAVLIALCRHKVMGLLEIPNIIQIFGDVLSYLRLYALGLSGALLTATMNELAGGVPIVFGILILVLGHAVNLLLGIMGGVVHGLRLNFLEWYHYCFEGGGKTFNPLRKHEIE